MLKRSVSLVSSIAALTLASAWGATQGPTRPAGLAVPQPLEAKLVSITSTASNRTHTVKKGETLWGISRKYQVNSKELAKLNGLPAESPTLRIGQKLRVPGVRKKTKKVSSSAPASKEVTGYDKYKVGDGETLYSIARRNGVSLAALKKANSEVNPNGLRVGQALLIPRYESVASTPKSEPVPKKKAPEAPKKKAPDPAPVAAVPPQRLPGNVAPPSDRANMAPKGYGIYTVQPGDTIHSIAKQYGISVTEFLRINQKSSYPNYQPRPNEFLMVSTDGTWYMPERRATTRTSTAPQRAPVRSLPLQGHRRVPTGSPLKVMLVQHEVRANDTLEGLAKRFSTTTDQIRLDNPGIQSNRDLQVGSHLKIRTQSAF